MSDPTLAKDGPAWIEAATLRIADLEKQLAERGFDASRLLHRAHIAEADLRQSRAETIRLGDAMAKIRDVIMALPQEACGIGHGEMHGHPITWPIRDELVHDMNVALSGYAAHKETK